MYYIRNKPYSVPVSSSRHTTYATSDLTPKISPNYPVSFLLVAYNDIRYEYCRPTVNPIYIYVCVCVILFNITLSPITKYAEKSNGQSEWISKLHIIYRSDFPTFFRYLKKCKYNGRGHQVFTEFKAIIQLRGIYCVSLSHYLVYYCFVLCIVFV